MTSETLTRAGWLVREVDERAGEASPDLPLLSVSEYRGVVPRRDDGEGQAASEDLSHYKICRPDDIVLNRLWAFRGGLGRSPVTGLVSPDYAVLRPKPGTEPRFLNYLFRSPPFVAEMAARSRGIGGIDASNGRSPRINMIDFHAIDVRIPGLEAQRRVADYLDAETARIDTLIAAQEQALTLMGEREAALTYHYVKEADGKITPICYLARYVNGYPFKPEDKGGDGLPIVRIAQLLDPQADVDRYAGTPDNYCHIDTGDLIFSWSTTLAARIWDRGSAYLNQHLFKVHPADGVDRDWLRFALEAAVHDLEPYMHGSTMTHITRPMMSAVGVPLPSLDQQQAISRTVTDERGELDRLRRATDRQIELLTERRQALITAAVTGQLDI